MGLTIHWLVVTMATDKATVTMVTDRHGKKSVTLSSRHWDKEFVT